MSLLDDLKAKVYVNSDGKIGKADLDDLRSKVGDAKIDQFKKIADQNDDGKLNLGDFKNIDLGGTFENIKKSI